MYDPIFDLDHDGKLDPLEEALAHEGLIRMEEDEAALEEKDDLGDDFDGGPDLAFATARAPRKALPAAPPAPPAPRRPRPAPISREKMRTRRKGILSSCVSVVSILVLSCAVPGVFMWALARAYDPANPAYGLLALLICTAACLWVGAAFRLIADVVSCARDSLGKLRDDYRKSVRQ